MAQELRALRYTGPIDEVDINLPDYSYITVARGGVFEVVPSGEPEEWLRKQLLIRDDKPTVAANLLFSDSPQAGMPNP